MPAAVRLAHHQRLRLCQRIGEQFLLMPRQRIGLCFDGDEFNWHHSRALVQHLKVGMLAIGTGLAPQHG